MLLSIVLSIISSNSQYGVFIEDSNDVLACIHNKLHCLLGIIFYYARIFISRISGFDRSRSGCHSRTDNPIFNFIGRNNLIHVIIETMTNGILNLIELEVELQDEGAGCRDGAGKHALRPIKRILAAFRSIPVFISYGSIFTCLTILTRYRPVRSIRIVPRIVLIVELNHILHIRADFPHGVEVVRLYIIYARGRAETESSTGAICLRVPAGQRITRLAEARFFRIERGDLGVIEQVFDNHIIARAAVGMIGNFDLTLHGAVDGREGRVGVHGDVGAGVENVPCLVDPVEEDLTFGRSKAALGHTGERIGSVLIQIFDLCISAIASSIGQFIRCAGKNRGDGRVLEQRLIDIDAFAFSINPLDQLKAILRDERQRGGINIRFDNSRTGRNRLRLMLKRLIRRYVDCDGNLNLRLYPIGVKHKVFRGHGFTSEVKRLHTLSNLRRCYFIPAHKLRIFSELARTFWCGTLTSNRRFIENVIGLFTTVIVQLKAKRFTRVIQISLFVLIKIGHNLITLLKAGNREIVLIIC